MVSYQYNHHQPKQYQRTRLPYASVNLLLSSSASSSASASVSVIIAHTEALNYDLIISDVVPKIVEGREKGTYEREDETHLPFQ
jgi:hypothetical protein